MSRKRTDQLEPWTVWLRDALTARGKPARLAYDDKLAGDVLLLSIDAGERDRLVEITVVRRPKGRAHVTAMATTVDGATAARDAMSRMYAEISRLANAKRKFIHRIERLLDQLARSWKQRAGEPARGRDPALERLRTTLPEAWPMIGVGFHTDIVGADDHHTKEVYPSVFGAAVLLDGRWRGLAWDPERQRWVIRAGTMTALRRGRPDVDLDQGGITLLEAALMATAAAGAAALIAGSAADINAEVVASQKADRSCSWSDAFDPCDVIDCSLELADLGNCVPDCGSLDCGGLDCSL